jgi:hypothetical protein
METRLQKPFTTKTITATCITMQGTAMTISTQIINMITRDITIPTARRFMRSTSTAIPMETMIIVSMDEIMPRSEL